MDLDSSKYFPGEAYCPDKVSGPECPPRGLFDISQCSMRGDVAPPIFASMPHFLNSLENLTAPFRGLKSADPRRDNFKLLVEPVSQVVVARRNLNHPFKDRVIRSNRCYSTALVK